MEKGPLHERIRFGRRHYPGRNEFGQSKHSGRIGLNQILVPEQPLKWRGHGGPGHVIQQKYFLLLQFGVRPFGHFGKQDDGDPAGGRTDAGTDHQLQIHTAGHHQKADEYRPDDGLPVKPFFKMLRRFEQIPVFFKFFVVVHICVAGCGLRVASYGLRVNSYQPGHFIQLGLLFPARPAKR